MNYIDRKKWYASMLKRPEWQAKRLEVLKRDLFQCQRCGVSHPAILQVHHLKYQGVYPWDTALEFLQILCKSCHFNTHF